MDPGLEFLQRTRALTAPLTALLASDSANTFDGRFDAFEEALQAWGAALDALDKTNLTQLLLAGQVVARVKPLFEQVAEMSKRLGATKGHADLPTPGSVGARRLRKTKTGRRARKATRRGRTVRS